VEDRPTEADLPPALSLPIGELDLVESGRVRYGRRESPVQPPEVRLGKLHNDGIAPAVAAIVERGLRLRPALACAVIAEVELKIRGGYPPVRVVFGERLVLVEDGPALAPDLRVEGELTDLVSMMATPLLGGMPNPINPRGRAALGKVVQGRVRVEGRVRLMRRLLAIVRI
jgi:hypothetical protein